MRLRTISTLLATQLDMLLLVSKALIVAHNVQQNLSLVSVINTIVAMQESKSSCLVQAILSSLFMQALST